MSGLMIAAPSSGSGKTTVTLALIAALTRLGISVSSAKAGPDYIDPVFHAAASGRPCLNLDPWAMRAPLQEALAHDLANDGDAVIVEAMMGLFDGAADGTGSAADLADRIGLRIVLVVDCARQSHSVAALVSGYANFRRTTPIAGLVLNRVGSNRHDRLLRDALEPLGIPVLASLPRRDDLTLPSRHLGLVQAIEHPALDGFFANAADWIENSADLATLRELARPGRTAKPRRPVPLAPIGQRIAIARDEAFAFAYPHVLSGWRAAGAELSFFSPLGDEPPVREADAVYLPGGYPELHGARLAAALSFASGMKRAADRGAAIYGECGGYMTLGSALIDEAGTRHEMLGLLPLVTSFASRKLHLGYRRLEALADGPFAGPHTAHEFHYATIVDEGSTDALFDSADARGDPLGHCGSRIGRVSGSFMHLIDRAG